MSKKENISKSKNRKTRGSDKQILLELLIISLRENWKSVLLVIVVFSEFMRKLTLHNAGVPIFVLDSEPLLTTFSYGKIWVLSVIFLLTIVVLDKWIRSFKESWLMGILGYLFLGLGIGWLITIVISLFATQNSKTNLIYVNSSYKVYAEPTEDFVAVYQIDKSTPLIYCRKLSFKQDCSETLSEIKKTREEKPFGF